MFHIAWISSGMFGHTMFFSRGAFEGESVMTGLQLLTIAVVVGIPGIGLLMGLYLTIQKRAFDLIRFMFKIEVPLFLLFLFRFGIGAYSYAFLFFLSLIVITCIIEIIRLLNIRKITESRHAGLLYEVSSLLGIIMSGYVFTIWLFFVFSIIGSLLGMVHDLLFSSYRPDVVFTVLALYFAFFFFCPLITFVAYAKDFYNKRNWKNLGLAFAAIFFIAISINYVEKYYPQGLVAQVLPSVTNNYSQESHKTIESKLPMLKKSLVTMYLARYRYQFDNTSSSVLQRGMCATDCGFAFELFKLVFFPMFYDGDLNSDQKIADELYKKIFDESIQKEHADKIKNYQSGSMINSFDRTNAAGIVDAKAESVHLESMIHKTEVHVQNQLAINTITFTFQNETTLSQEAFIEFSLPNSSSVITDLKLGLNLEKPSIPAPKGAANQVYEMSLRQGIDPALIEQTGPSSYKLRVFPIFSKEGLPTKGKQKVQIEYVTHNKNLVLSVPMHTRNIKIDRNTKIEGTIQSNADLMLDQDNNPNIALSTNGNNSAWKVNADDTKDFVKTTQILTAKSAAQNVCVQIKSGNSFITANYNNAQSIQNKNIAIFLDISKSADNPKQHEIYKQFIKNTRKISPNVTIYTYNFKVQKFDSDIDYLKFWGYSNSEVVPEFLNQNALKADAIFVLSDDSDFQYYAENNYEISYDSLSKSPIYFVQIGEYYSAQKEAVMNMVLASGGNATLINPKEDFDTISAQDIVIMRTTWTKSDSESTCSTTESDPKWRETVEDLYAYHAGTEELKKIKDIETRNEIGQEQTKLALRAHIANQFNSLIAVETEAQRKMLERLSNEEDKFKEDYDIGEEELVAPPLIASQSTPEASWIMGMGIIVLMIVFIKLKKYSI